MGVDVGGTKTLALLVRPTGTVVARKRAPTPRGVPAEETLEAIIKLMEELLLETGIDASNLEAVGLAIPGVIDSEEGRIIVTPNMSLTGLVAEPVVEERLGVPVALGNDVNLGTLGERWLGSARMTQSVVGIFVGTGIGGGLIIDGKLMEGYRKAAGEIGHIVMEVDGPLCACGNHGCLEALASRTAIERDIREAVAAGKTTILTKLSDNKLSIIRSGMLKEALEKHDPLVTKVLRRAARYLGFACLTVRHLVDPEMIVLGGGVIEACGDFLMPIVAEVVAADALPGARTGGRVLPSALGDDAVALGAVALAMERIGHNPYKLARRPRMDYPTIERVRFGEITIGGKAYKADVYIRADGKVKKRRKRIVREMYGSSRKIGPEELQKVLKGQPDTLVIGTGYKNKVTLTPEAEDFLRTRGTTVELLSTLKAVRAYNQAKGAKAALLHVTC
jgi:glucokinase